MAMIKPKQKKCKACKSLYRPYQTTQTACGIACAIILAKRKAERKDKEKSILAKKVFYATDLKTRKAGAKRACHAYIRLRDKGLPCICCNRPIVGDVHAGHYLESGNNPHTRYDENNIHAQSNYCNTYQGGDSDDYRGNLIKKIGLDEVLTLESMKGGTVKRTCDDLAALENYFNSKIKLLKEGD